MDVAGAVAVNLGDVHPHDELGPGVFGQQRVIVHDAGGALNPQPLLPLEIDEQQPHMGVPQQIAHRLILAVAIVVGKGQRMLIHHPHEPRIAAFVGTGGQPPVVAGRQKEHPRRRHQFLRRIGQRGRNPLFQPVGQPPGLKAVLQTAVAIVVIVNFHRLSLPLLTMMLPDDNAAASRRTHHPYCRRR